MRTFIELKNLSFYAYHGVLSQETKIGNKFEVNIKIEYDFIKAIDSDDVVDTLNYADVYNIIKEEMMIPSKLLESVAGRIFRKLKQQFDNISISELRVAKYNPPVNGEAEKSEIIITE